MAEGSQGRDYRPSHGAFRAVEGTYSNSPKLQQARRITSSADHSPSLRHRIRNIALALGIATGAGATGIILANEDGKVPVESLSKYSDQIKSIDMNKYLINIHVEGQARDLKIRHDPFMPDFDDRQEGRDNYITMDNVVSLNGSPWDGKSPVTIENSPIAMATDPATGILEAPWFAVKIGKKSLLGDITETVGFISHSPATDAHITPIESDGGVINAGFENGQIVGKNEYGETVLPADRIGLVNIADQSVTSQIGNPQPQS